MGGLKWKLPDPISVLKGSLWLLFGAWTVGKESREGVGDVSPSPDIMVTYIEVVAVRMDQNGLFEATMWRSNLEDLLIN